VPELAEITVMKILVVTSVFPNSRQPGLGVFVRERMFKVAQHCELKVVAPAPWFPLINRIKKDYRPLVPYHEVQDGIDVYHPRFFNIPRYFKFLDGFFFFLCTFLTLKKIRKSFDFDLIDAHFVYPDGFGAVLLGKYFRKPVNITVRGTLRKFSSSPIIPRMIRYALRNTAQVFTVCDDLRHAAIDAGGAPERIAVITNGVDSNKFFRIDQREARKKLGLEQNRKILISVGGLTERKGFHRIIQLIPELRKRYPDLLYVIVGGSSVEGNNEVYLRQLIDDLDVKNLVYITGPKPHQELYLWLNAADVFCLATANEGWANVFLEAMACGLPVVTTDVGGNREVVCSEDVGILVPFFDADKFKQALETALDKEWKKELITDYAKNNSWDQRIQLLDKYFNDLIQNTKS